jgi:hypothetical protein
MYCEQQIKDDIRIPSYERKGNGTSWQAGYKLVKKLRGGKKITKRNP